MDDPIVRQQQQDLIRQQQLQQDFFQQQQVQQNLTQQGQQPDLLSQPRAQEDLAREQLERQRANEDARISGLVSSFNPGTQSNPFDVDGSVNRPQEEQELYNQQLQDRLSNQRQVQDEVEEAFKNARVEGALIELQEHGAARAIRGDAGVSGCDVQSMHLAPQAAMKGVPGYDPREALTVFGKTDDHRSIDAHWKAEFQRRADQGQTTITAQDLFETVSGSVRQGNFSDAEKQSLILRLQDELFVDRGLAPNTQLRLPYS